MSMDTFTTTALAETLSERLVGGRVQNTVELDRETFGFEIYNQRERHYLLLSANNQEPRALIAPDKLRRGVQTPSPLGLMLRNRVDKMRLMAVTQPPWERILQFEFANPDEELTVVLELMPRRANLILLDGNMIMDSARRVGPQDNRYRIILPKHEYLPPPPIEGKVHPSEVTPIIIERLLRQSPDDKAWSVLVKGILGLSPIIGKELVFRAYQKPNIKAKDTNPYNLHAAFESFVPRLVRREWQPGVVLDDFEQPASVVVFEVTHTAYRAVADVNTGLNEVHGELRGEAAYDAARQPLEQQIANARKRVERKLHSLEREMADEDEIENLRKSGELLLAYQYTITEGQETLEAQYDPEGEPLVIRLNTDMTPLENAQRYFERYEKKKRAFAQIPERIEATEIELDYIDQLASDLMLASNWNDIGEVQEALQKSGYWQGKKYAQPKGGKSGPLKVNTDAGFVIFVGRNSRQNDGLVTRSEPYDLWLHVRGAPGSHVLIKTNAKTVPDEVIAEAASYAAYYSKLRTEQKVTVMVAEARHVRKIKGAKPGQVRVHQELSSMYVEPAPVEEH